MLEIAPGVSIDEKDIRESFVQASGPGGQHVNKNATAVQIQIDLTGIEGLRPDAKARLIRLAGKRISPEGLLTMTCQEHRSQYRNRQEAMTRIMGLIREALVRPKPRKKTKPSKSAKKRRLDEKTRRGKAKASRGRVNWDE